MSMMESAKNVKMPKTVYLLGKGPSLDDFNPTKDKYLVGINELALLYKCHVAICTDYKIFDIYDVYLNTDVLVLKRGDKEYARYNYTNMFVYEFGKEIEKLMGTAPVAIQVLAYLSVRYIHFVGFDSMDGDFKYSEIIKAAGAEGETTDDYKRIRENIRKVIKSTGITPIWEHLK